MITTSLSFAHQKKKNSSQISPYTKLTQTTAPTKRKKEFNLEPWEKETSNTIRLKKNKEKAEKYCTNEGTNEKHRSPNKLRKLGKLPEKEFRIMIVKMIKKKKKESIAEYLKWKNEFVSWKIKWWK